MNVAAAFMVTIALPGCGMLPFQGNDSQEMVKEAATVRQPGIYDSEDAAVVVKGYRSGNSAVSEYCDVTPVHTAL